MIHELLHESMIIPGMKAETSTDVLKQLGSTVVESGYAKPSYIQALIDREAEFPTGLDMGSDICVAIPHTNIDHVNDVAVAVATLEKPVTFIHMATEDDEVEARVIFMLAVVDPKAHLESLQHIIEMLQNGDVLHQLVDAKTPAEIIDIVAKAEEAMA